MKANRWIVIVLLLALLLAVARTVTPTSAATPTLSLVAPAQVLTTTVDYDVPIVVSGTANLGAFEFDLVYDQTRVQVISVTLNSYLGGLSGCNPASTRCAFLLGPTTSTPGMTSIGGWSTGAGGGPGGTGTLGVIHLHRLATSGTIALMGANALLSDTTGNSSTPVVMGGTSTITSPAPLLKLFLPLVQR